VSVVSGHSGARPTHALHVESVNEYNFAAAFAVARCGAAPLSRSYQDLCGMALRPRSPPRAAIGENLDLGLMREVPRLDWAASSRIALGRPNGVSVEKCRDVGHDAALHGVSLEIESGGSWRCSALGSGKTRCSGILPASTFRPSVAAVRRRRRAEADLQQRNVGLVFQNYALFRHMTVLENIARLARASWRGDEPQGDPQAPLDLLEPRATPGSRSATPRSSPAASVSA